MTQKGNLPLYFISVVFVLLSACSTSTPLSFTPTPNVVAQGRELFLNICAECHGQDANGYANVLNAPALNNTEHAWHHPDQEIFSWIVKGKLGIGRQMPGFGDQLSDEQVYAVIEYLHSLWTEEQLASQQDITARWPVTPTPRNEP